MASAERFADNGLYEWHFPSPLQIKTIAVGSMIMCAYIDGLLYEATVLEITGQPGMRKFKLHYPAWGTSYDEVVDEATATVRFYEHTPEIAKYFEILQKQSHDEEHRDKRFGIVPPPANVQSIAVGSMIMFAHTDGLLYEATVLEITDQPGMREFKLHFPAWGKSHDEVIDETNATALFHEHTPEIAKYFKNLRKQWLAEERKAKHSSKRRSADNIALTIRKATKNGAGTSSKSGSSSSIPHLQKNHAASAKQHRSEARFEDFYAFFLRAYKKRSVGIDFISKTSIAKEVRSQATDHRFTPDEVDEYFKRLNDDGIIMFVNVNEDRFMVI